MSIQASTEILYFYDALCGWCYGFSPVINSLHAQYGDHIRFRVFSGGMMMGERCGSINEVAPFIKGDALKELEVRTGIKFGKKFLEEVLEPGTAVLSSLEPAIAMSVFKSFETGKDVAFAAALQKAIYFDGVLSTDLNGFIPYALALGIDEQEFKIRMNDPLYHDMAFDDFRTCQRFGIQGFPSTVLLHEDKYYLLAHGYTDYDSINARLKEYLEVESKPA